MSASGFNMYAAIIKPLRDADSQGTLLLQRYMTGPQAEHDRAEAAILSLYEQINPSEVQTDLLPYLMPLVGFTSDLRDITDRLTEAQLRRLVNVAVPLWNQRHTLAGLVNAIRLLTGRAAFVRTWFSYRAIIGEVMLTDEQGPNGPDFWCIGGETSVQDEFWSNIRLMDDGTLDELLLIDVCQLMRPFGERFEILICDFLDHFDGVLDKWVNADGFNVPSQGLIDTVTFPGTLKLLPSPSGTVVTSLEPIIPLLPNRADNHDYTLQFKINIPVGGQARVRWYCDGSSQRSTSYELNIGTDGNGGLTRWTSGTGNNLFLSAAWPPACKLHPGVWYTITITTTTVDANTRAIRVLVDGNQAVNVAPLFELIDGSGTSNNAGGYMFVNPSTTEPLWLDNVESWRCPARFATIDKSNALNPGGVVVMSSNFVQ